MAVVPAIELSSQKRVSRRFPGRSSGVAVGIWTRDTGGRHFNVSAGTCFGFDEKNRPSCLCDAL